MLVTRIDIVTPMSRVKDRLTRLGDRPTFGMIRGCGCFRENTSGETSMPTVLRVGPYRFFFYAGDGDEPPHVHVERDDSEAKIWLDPIRLERSGGFSAKELRRIEQSVTDHHEQLMDSWNDFFNG